MRISTISILISKLLITDKDDHLSYNVRKNANLTDSITAGINLPLIPKAQTS